MAHYVTHSLWRNQCDKICHFWLIMALILYIGTGVTKYATLGSLFDSYTRRNQYNEMCDKWLTMSLIFHVISRYLYDNMCNFRHIYINSAKFGLSYFMPIMVDYGTIITKFWPILLLSQNGRLWQHNHNQPNLAICQ